VALAFWIVAGFAAAVGDPGRGWIARMRRRKGDEPTLDTGHEPEIGRRPRTGNVRPMPRGPV
jgi:hypothetical protein